MAEPKSFGPKERRRLRLLVVEDTSTTGGIQTVLLSLMPELACHCERMVWMLPKHRIAATSSKLPKNHSIQFESLHRERWQKGWFTQRLLACTNMAIVTRTLSSFRSILVKRLKRLRLRSVIRHHNITHLLNPSVFNQDYPETNLPVFGIVHDTNFSPEWREQCQKALTDWAQKADGIITISAWSRNQIVEAVPFAVKKVHAVPNAVTPPKLVVQNTRSTESNGDKCFFYPASFNFHKNHFNLLVALSTLHQEGLRFRMVFCGHNTDLLLSPNPLSNDGLEAARAFLASAELEFRNKIKIQGLVDEHQLEVLFKEATHVLLPSTYEGYGLPLTEAVARGVPVLCSDIPAYKEQVEFYGITKWVTFVAGTDSESWADAIRCAWTKEHQSIEDNEEVRFALNRWTWADVARSYVDLIQGDDNGVNSVGV
jgi:glycosyltransferase involved in cell wall biosynthesis